MTHNITTTNGATCDGMTVFTCTLHNGTTTTGVNVEGFDSNVAVGICLTCHDLAYPCDGCLVPTCVNALNDNAEDDRFLCDTCETERTDGGYDGPAFVILDMYGRQVGSS